MEDRLIIGLGNPGLKYAGTRHNIAWDLIDQTFSLDWKSKFKGEYSSLDDSTGRIYFLKPQTYMNLSGESAKPMMDFFKIKKENILIVHDELDFPFGTVGFKPGGGLAGHNGLKSLALHLGDGEFKRLRLGIGRPVHGTVSDWVLSRFGEAEAPVLDSYFKLAGSALECYIKHGFEKAASLYSKKSIFL